MWNTLTPSSSSLNLKNADLQPDQVFALFNATVATPSTTTSVSHQGGGRRYELGLAQLTREILDKAVVCVGSGHISACILGRWDVCKIAFTNHHGDEWSDICIPAYSLSLRANKVYCKLHLWCSNTDEIWIVVKSWLANSDDGNQNDHAIMTDAHLRVSCWTENDTVDHLSRHFLPVLQPILTRFEMAWTPHQGATAQTTHQFQQALAQ